MTTERFAPFVASTTRFGLALVHTRVDATGAASLDSWLTVDPVTLAVQSTTDANLTQHGFTLDGFGRPTQRTVTPPGSSAGVVWVGQYLGFSGTDPLGRRVVSTSFTDPVAPRQRGQHARPDERGVPRRAGATAPPRGVAGR